MKYKPTGFYVLVEMEDVSNEVESGALKGFTLNTPEEHKREQAGACVGKIVEFGPAAYRGFPGCDGPEDWGVAIGDRFETNRYAGDICRGEGCENHRILADSEIKTIIKEV